MRRLAEGLLGSGVGERTRAFLAGLGWNLPAAALTRVAAGIATLLAARWLGPVGYGEANLALAASLWFQVPLLAGLPAAMMHNLARAAPAQRDAWSSTALVLMAACGAATLGVGVLARAPLASGIGVPEEMVLLSLSWCAGFWFYSAGTSLLAGGERFRARAGVELVFGLVFPSSLALLWAWDRLDAPGYVLSLTAGFGVAGAAGLLIGRPRRPAFSMDKARALGAYGALGAVGVLAAALLQSLGRLVANRHLDLDQVGILSAYQAGSIPMTLFFLTFGVPVFFPIASRTPDREALLRKLTRLLVPVVGLGAAGGGTMLLAYLWLLGDRYPLMGAEVAAFSAASGLALGLGSLTWFLASGGRRGLAASVGVSLLAGAVNAAACQVLIPTRGVLGAGLALALAYAVGIAACFLPVARRWGTA